MKKKLLTLILIPFLLTGCSEESTSDIQTDEIADETLNTIFSENVIEFVKDVFTSTLEVLTSPEAGESIDEVKDMATEFISDADLSDEVSSSNDIITTVVSEAGNYLNSAADNEVTSESTQLVEVTLSSVVDGDTLWVLKDGEKTKIRLIGIDTPESVHSDSSKNNEYGTMASDHTKELLSNVETLYLEYDEEAQDKYGRDLAYVWFNTDTSDFSNMLNAKILMDGYANVLTIAPNDKYADDFLNLKTTAYENRTGLWDYEGYIDLIYNN